MSEAEEKLREILEKHITLHSIHGGYGVFNITSFEAIVNNIIEAGYVKVEPVHLEVLTDEEILSAFDGDFSPVYFDHNPTADEVMLIKLKLVVQATLAHNEAKGQLYRRKAE